MEEKEAKASGSVPSGTASGGSGRYLSPLGAWALSFGCAVGWGAFIMPGTTFLPAAGPMGSVLGLVIGALVMLVTGVNYHYLMNKYPDAGGTLTYASRVFGSDHGFLSAWFLALVYVAITWANATALTLIARNLLGSTFQFGFHYQILGYDVWLEEALLSIAAILLFGFVCIRGKRLAVGIQIVLALVLFGGIAAVSWAVLGRHGGTGQAAVSAALFPLSAGQSAASGGPYPLFAPTGQSPLRQTVTIIALAPWAYVGFESISHSTGDFRFSPKKSMGVFAAALTTSALAYLLLALIAAGIRPEGYADWTAYIADRENLSGLASMPVFYATYAALGRGGLLLLGLTLCAAVITGLVGNTIAASRLLYAMAQEKILPRWFGVLNRDGVPRNALLFLMAISVWIPFLGRTAVGWIVDVNTIGAVIAYGYTAAAAFVTARREGNRPMKAAGIVGIASSIGFFLYFMALSAGAMSTESYLILALWSILGFVFFRWVYSRDREEHFGKSVVVWIGLLFLIFFTSLMWIRQATDNMTRTVVDNISEYYEEMHPDDSPEVTAETEAYLSGQLAAANRLLTRNSMIQMGLIVASLAIMFNLFTTMSRRQQDLEVRRVKAEESSKAKSVFLSNMSHDIRTPMNAIIGYTNLAERSGNTLVEVRGYLEKIKASSLHLLSLINDVLEMSRIESGKMELENVPDDLVQALDEVRDMFSTQMEGKKIDFTVDTAQVKNRRAVFDRNRLNRVLLNLLSNAFKFTPEGGTVSVFLWQIEDGEKGFGKYELRVRDSGIGMTPEFAARVFEAFERERTSTVSGIQGTGLGMAITKSIVDLMGGTIEVHTAPGEGTEFVIQLHFPLAEGAEAGPDSVPAAGTDSVLPPGMDSGSAAGTDSADGSGTDETDSSDSADALADYSGLRLLLVDDNEINREIATLLLEEAGFLVEEAVDGRDAADRVAASEPGYFGAVLMDIQMPVMNGYEATRTIRRLSNPELAQIPIIAMTANAFSEDIQAASEAGMNGHIAKPVDVPKMLGTLRTVLRRRGKQGLAQ